MEELGGIPPRAIDYAGLVGKYVCMERPLKDEVEILEARASGLDPETATHGCEGLVALVYDAVDTRVGGPCVEVIMDYGIGFPIFGGEEWRFHVWPDEQMMRDLRMAPDLPRPADLAEEARWLRSSAENGRKRMRELGYSEELMRGYELAVGWVERHASSGQSWVIRKS